MAYRREKSMAIRLNGWRRIALALTVLWVCIAITATGSDYFNKGKGNGYFVYQSIPFGILVTGNTAILPDGRKMQISDQEEIEFSVRREKKEGKTPIKTSQCRRKQPILESRVKQFRFTTISFICF